MEITIQVKEIAEFKWGQDKIKIAWNVIAEDGKKYTTFSDTHMKYIVAGESATLKYEEKVVNNFTNYNIQSVKDDQGNWTESGKSASGGGRAAKADPEKMKQDKELEIARNQSIQRQQGVIQAVLLKTGSKDYQSKDLIDIFNEVMALITTPWVKK